MKVIKALIANTYFYITYLVQNQLDISKLVIQDKNLELFLEDQMKRKNISRSYPKYL